MESFRRGREGWCTPGTVAAVGFALGLFACGTQPASSPLAAAPIPEGLEVRAVGPAVRIVDGDTLVVARGEVVRVLGIDTPETRAGDALVRELAATARGATSSFLAGRDVTLVVGRPQRDVHGRTLAYVHAGKAPPDGPASPATDLSAHLLAQGLAQVHPTPHPRIEAYRDLALAARDAQRGIWAPAARTALGLEPVATIAAHEAGDHVGQHVHVEGRVASVRRSAAGIFLAVGEAERPRVRVAALRSRIDLFPAGIEARWRGNRVIVAGIVKRYRGQPEILLDHPDQVQVLHGTAAELVRAIALVPLPR